MKKLVNYRETGIPFEKIQLQPGKSLLRLITKDDCSVSKQEIKVTTDAPDTPLHTVILSDVFKPGDIALILPEAARFASKRTFVLDNCDVLGTWARADFEESE
jgi:hypothetical protein